MSKKTKLALRARQKVHDNRDNRSENRSEVNGMSSGCPGN